MSVAELVQSAVDHVPPAAHHAFTVVSLAALGSWIVGFLPTYSLIITAVWGTLKVVEAWLKVKALKKGHRR